MSSKKSPNKWSVHCVVSKKFPLDQAYTEAKTCGFLTPSDSQYDSYTSNGIRIEKSISFKVLRTFPVQFFGSNVNVSLQLVAENVLYKRMLSRDYSKQSHKFVSTYSTPKRGQIKTFCISVGDLLKLYRFASLSATATSENDNNAVENDDGNSVLQVDRHNAVVAKHSQKLMKKRREQLLKAASKYDASASDSTNFLGRLHNGLVSRLPAHDHRMGNLEDFLDSKVMLGDLGIASILATKFENRRTGQTIEYSDDERRSRLGVWLTDLVSKELVNTLTGYFFFQKTLRGTEEEKVVTFDEPITMLEFYNMIDNDTVYFDKNALYNRVFKKLNEHQQAVVDKQDPLVVSKIEDIPEELPAYVFRQLRFRSFSPTFAGLVYESVLEAIETWSIPKRFKNKAQQCVRNEWRYKCKVGNKCELGWNKKKYIYNSYLTQQGLDEVYGLEGDVFDEYDDDDDDGVRGCHDSDDRHPRYAYPLPEEVVLDEIDGNDARYSFMTDEEALQRCVEVDEDQTLSLTEKLRQLNSIGHSRVGGDYIGYLLLLPGENLADAASTNSAAASNSGSSEEDCMPIETESTVHYQDFYVPSSDQRLPSVVLIGAPDNK